MFRLGRKGQLALLPQWVGRRLNVHLLETDRLLEIARQETPAGARVLDAGSGEGQYSHYFEHTHYTGVDLAVGDEQWDYSALDAQADLRRLPFAEGVFDAAICFQTLEHVNEPKQVIGEIARVLRPGGRLYLSAPMSWHQHQKPHDYFRYTSFGFRHLLEQSGLLVVEMRPWGGYFWFLSYNFQMMHDRLFPRPAEDWKYLLMMPVVLPIQLLFFLILPLILFSLDRLDKTKDHTLGWACIAEKMSPDEHGSAAVQ
jgi:SAM-dependent methyltransferase